MLAQLVEHCTGIAEVMGTSSVQAYIFQALFSLRTYCLSRIYYCEDRFHIHFKTRSPHNLYDFHIFTVRVSNVTALRFSST